MVLILGGAGAGKSAYARSLGYADEEISRDVFSDAPVMDELEEAVRTAPEKAESLLDTLLAKEVVICREVGSGVIPLAKEDRLFRETAGRLCVLLAQRADHVVRMVAGIPVPIKGGLPCRRS